MSSSFPDSLDHFADESPKAGSARHFEDGYLAPYAFANVTGSPPPIDIADPEDLSSDELILPPQAEMEPEEGDAVREWRRQNVIRLEEKERMEKELLSKIILEAEEYKVEFQRKRQFINETNRATNREKEEVFVAIQEKFYAEADEDYWKSIGELIPKEVPTIETRKGKKNQEKNPSAFAVQGPKPGKPTDLARMRQILVKLKHDTPPHLKPSLQAAPDANTDTSAAVAVSSEAVVVA